MSRKLVLREADSTRARDHPIALAGLWAWQAGLAIGVGYPAASFVASAYGAGPRGDGPLWDAGAHALLDFLWHGARGLASVVSVAELVLVVGAVAGLVPAAAVMIAMCHATPDGRAAGWMACLTDALKMFPRLALLLVVVTLLQGATLGIGAIAATTAQDLAKGGLGEERSERMAIAIAVVFLILASGLGVVHDLARAAVVRLKARAVGALRLGAQAFGRAPLPLWWSWAWRALVSLAPAAAVALVARRIGGRGGWALVLLALLHQAVVVARVALRMSWLAHVLRTLGQPDPPPSDR